MNVSFSVNVLTKSDPKKKQKQCTTVYNAKTAFSNLATWETSLKIFVFKGQNQCLNVDRRLK